MPILYILAGPNGAGKTTFYLTGVEEGFIDKTIPFINADLIIKNELGTYTEENFIRAESIVRERIGKHISNKENFMIESNLAKQSDYNWLNSIKAHGYDIIIYFLCTNNININKHRIKKRVKEGGHDVPENIVENRYRVALIYLKTEILNFNQVHLIENSGRRPEEIAVVKEGKVVKKKDNSIEWVNKVLYLAERLRDKELNFLFAPQKFHLNTSLPSNKKSASKFAA